MVTPGPLPARPWARWAASLCKPSGGRGGCSSGFRCACFVAGTLVATSAGAVPIECLRADDQVLTRDDSRPDAEPRVAGVADVFTRVAAEVLWITLDSGEVLGATPDHEVWSYERGWMLAGRLTEGQHLMDLAGARAEVVEIVRDPTPTVVYNFEVEDGHTYYANGVWVHNCRDFPTSLTHNWSAWFKSEGEARQLARQKVGPNLIEFEPNKWRSQDGKWQYRARPDDVASKHIHLEELDPSTGEVLQNLHLRWK